MELGDIKIDLIQKNIKNVHLSVMPPYGDVRISAPLHLTEETIRLYAISKLSWIKKEQKKIRSQARESKREFINKETHYFQGRKYLLEIIEDDLQSKIVLQKKHIQLFVKPNTNTEQCQLIFNEWYRSHLKKVIPTMIKKWEKILGVELRGFGIKQMKTKWGTCNIEVKRIWLNLELAKKPLHCLEYIVVHELVHLLERNHNERFLALMNKFLPDWRELKSELNKLPVSHSDWGY
ncbi:MAG: M48 family metallopeptidase [Opitutaceae bacterium]|nr:M48 family metallopeptidase [Cytophagales bacterium]